MAYSHREAACNLAVLNRAAAEGRFSYTGMLKLAATVGSEVHARAVRSFLRTVREEARKVGVRVELRGYAEVGAIGLALHHHYLLVADHPVTQAFVRRCWSEACQGHRVVVDHTPIRSVKAVAAYTCKAGEVHRDRPLLARHSPIRASWGTRNWYGPGGQTAVWANLREGWYGSPEPGSIGLDTEDRGEGPVLPPSDAAGQGAVPLPLIVATPPTTESKTTKAMTRTGAGGGIYHTRRGSDCSGRQRDRWPIRDDRRSTRFSTDRPGRASNVWVTKSTARPPPARTPRVFIHCSTYHEDAPMTPPHNPTETSRDAAESMVRSAATIRAEVLELIRAAGRAGLTADEVERETGRRSATVTPRIWELRRLGLVEKTNRTRSTAAGRQAGVYIAVGAEANR